MNKVVFKVFFVTFHILAVLNSIQSFSDDCDDSDRYSSQCPKWALKGECTKKSGFMKKFCKKSCNECPIQWARSYPSTQGKKARDRLIFFPLSRG